jgi:hypothetical protein
MFCKFGATLIAEPEYSVAFNTVRSQIPKPVFCTRIDRASRCRTVHEILNSVLGLPRDVVVLVVLSR